MAELRWHFSALLSWRKRKVETCPFYIISSFSTHSLSSRKAMKRSTSLFPPSKQRVHKSQFLQKLSCQKPYWDQARLSSLVYKQVANTSSFPPLHLGRRQPWTVRDHNISHKRDSVAQVFYISVSKDIYTASLDPKLLLFFSKCGFCLLVDFACRWSYIGRGCDQRDYPV